jgi:hypothetical protein
MKPIEELIKKSVDAHIVYMYNKIHDKDERIGFIEAHHGDNVIFINKSKKYIIGYQNYLKLYDSIRKNINDRFEFGWSKSYIDGFERI